MPCGTFDEDADSELHTRAMLEHQVEQLDRDPEFQARLRRIMSESRPIIDGLRDSDAAS
jgi:hypothetical protein